ncbi:hypothetical protein BGX31_004305 [Mortierella sp. GBA43]|nr:hypothetical protein BGX31_004305 [Mortierella sp. GBA43]
MTNSWLCGFQGISLMYLVLAMLCLAVLMITNLHFLAVHRSGFVQTHMTKFIVLSFILPLSLVLPVAIRQQIENPGFGSICFVSAQVASPYFFYPLAVIVTLATLLHLGTIIFMIRSTIRARSASVSDSVPSDSEFSSSDGSGKGPSKKIRGLQTARDISLFFKQQWRPGLFALWTLIVQMIYWLFYFLEAKKLETIQSNPPWFSQWVLCLVQQAGISAQSGLLSLTSPTPDQLQIAGDAAQRACASIAESNVPSFMWAAFADMLPATIGITNLIIFGTKLELWQDLRNLLCGAPRKTTEYSMDRVSKESQDRHHRHHSQSDDQDHDQTQEKRGHGIQGKQSKQHSRQDGSDFKNKDHRTDDGEFHTSRDILIAPPQSMAQNGSIGMALQSESRVDTHSAAGIGAGASGSSPTASGSLKGSNGRPSFGGPTRKLSVRFQDREPILYRQPSTTESAPSPPSPSPPSPRQPTQSPSRHFPHSGPLDIQSLQSHQDSLHEKINLHHARLVTEGTDPWPSWPSSVPTIDTPSSAPLIVEARRPSLTVRTNSMGSQQHRQNPSISSSNPRATPVSPRTPDLSSSRAGFYNSEDLAAGEALQAARRGSNNSTSTTQGHPPTPTRVGSVRDTGRGPSYEYDRREQSPIYGDASLPSPVHALSPPPVPQRSQSRRRS